MILQITTPVGQSVTSVLDQDDDTRSELSDQSRVQEGSIASDGVILHAPSRTLKPKHVAEFLTVIKNLHTVLGDDLPCSQAEHNRC